MRAREVLSYAAFGLGVIGILSYFVLRARGRRGGAARDGRRLKLILAASIVALGVAALL